jgi:hypothetical protein
MTGQSKIEGKFSLANISDFSTWITKNINPRNHRQPPVAIVSSNEFVDEFLAQLAVGLLVGSAHGPQGGVYNIEK